MNIPLHIASDHPAYVGHFPGFAIFPGAALLDLALHAIAGRHALDLRHWQIATVKFLRVVRPGEPLDLQHSVSPTQIRFAIRHADGVVASGILSIVSVEPGTVHGG